MNKRCRVNCGTTEDSKTMLEKIVTQEVSLVGGLELKCELARVLDSS